VAHLRSWTDAGNAPCNTLACHEETELLDPIEATLQVNSLIKTNSIAAISSAAVLCANFLISRRDAAIPTNITPEQEYNDDNVHKFISYTVYDNPSIKTNRSSFKHVVTRLCQCKS
jgi:hypothetical protein